MAKLYLNLVFLILIKLCFAGDSLQVSLTPTVIIQNPSLEFQGIRDFDMSNPAIRYILPKLEFSSKFLYGIKLNASFAGATFTWEKTFIQPDIRFGHFAGRGKLRNQDGTVRTYYSYTSGDTLPTDTPHLHDFEENSNNLYIQLPVWKSFNALAGYGTNKFEVGSYYGYGNFMNYYDSINLNYLQLVQKSIVLGLGKKFTLNHNFSLEINGLVSIYGKTTVKYAKTSFTKPQNKTYHHLLGKLDATLHYKKLHITFNHSFLNTAHQKFKLRSSNLFVGFTWNVATIPLNLSQY